MAERDFRLALILGGARSGKSRHGESLARSVTAQRYVYVATAEAGDEEMAARIALHRERRGSDWLTIEEPLALARVLGAQVGPSDAVLVDCLTLWLSNLMLGDRNVDAEVAALCRALGGTTARVVMVSNEVGLGIVPENALARRFRDEAGRLNQRVAALADRVEFMAAGLPLVLKGG